MADRPAPVGASVVARPDPLTLLLFAGVVLIGGSNFIAVRFTVLEMPPFWSAALRFAVAGLLFWAAAVVQRDHVPRGRVLTSALLAGAPAIGTFYGLLYWSLTFVPAGVASVLAALTPLVTFLLAVVHRMETFRFRALAGAAIAVAGIGVAFFRAPEGTLILLPVLGMLFYLYVVVIRRWTASGTAYAFVLFPFVTVALEWLLTDEPLTAGLIAGAALVIVGVWIGALARARS